MSAGSGGSVEGRPDLGLSVPWVTVLGVGEVVSGPAVSPLEAVDLTSEVDAGSVR